MQHPEPWTITQAELAQLVGCSQATVSRDLAKMGSSRWNPFRLLQLRLIRELRTEEEQRRREWEQQMESMSSKEWSQLLARFLSIPDGGRWYPKHSKPRGKPFSSEYQPQWGRWGTWPFRCHHCGCEGTVEVTGVWRKGETLRFDCPQCGQVVGITRPS